jgi:hypothetical protein
MDGGGKFSSLLTLVVDLCHGRRFGKETGRKTCQKGGPGGMVICQGCSRYVVGPRSSVGRLKEQQQATDRMEAMKSDFDA